jgi:archaellum component FlaC
LADKQVVVKVVFDFAKDIANKLAKAGEATSATQIKKESGLKLDISELKNLLKIVSGGSGGVGSKATYRETVDAFLEAVKKIPSSSGKAPELKVPAVVYDKVAKVVGNDIAKYIVDAVKTEVDKAVKAYVKPGQGSARSVSQGDIDKSFESSHSAYLQRKKAREQRAAKDAEDWKKSMARDEEILFGKRSGGGAVGKAGTSKKVAEIKDNAIKNFNDTVEGAGVAASKAKDIFSKINEGDIAGAVGEIAALGKEVKKVKESVAGLGEDIKDTRDKIQEVRKGYKKPNLGVVGPGTREDLSGIIEFMKPGVAARKSSSAPPPGVVNKSVPAGGGRSYVRPEVRSVGTAIVSEEQKYLDDLRQAREVLGDISAKKPYIRPEVGPRAIPPSRGLTEPGLTNEEIYGKRRGYAFPGPTIDRGTDTRTALDLLAKAIIKTTPEKERGYADTSDPNLISAVNVAVKRYIPALKSTEMLRSEGKTVQADFYNKMFMRGAEEDIRKVVTAKRDPTDKERQYILSPLKSAFEKTSNRGLTEVLTDLDNYNSYMSENGKQIRYAVSNLKLLEKEIKKVAVEAKVKVDVGREKYKYTSEIEGQNENYPSMTSYLEF